MAEKTTAQKLVVKPGHALWLSDAARADLIGELPADVTLAARAEQVADRGDPRADS